MKPNTKTYFTLTAALTMLLALLVAPGIISFGIRSGTTASLANSFQGSLASQPSISEISFNRHWFSSSAVLLASIPGATGDNLGIEMSVDIQHGPLLFTQQGLRLGIAHAVITPDLKNLPWENEDIEIQAEASLFADFDKTLFLTASISPFENLRDDLASSFGGAIAEMTIEPNQSAVFSAIFSNFYLEDKQSEQSLAVTDLTIEGSSVNISDFLSPSQLKLSIDSVDSQTTQPLIVRGVEVSTSIDGTSESDSLSASQELSVETIEGDFTIESLLWTSSVSRFPRSGVDRYLGLLAQSQRLAQDASPQALNQLNQITQEIGLLMINNPIAIESTISAIAFEGEHEANFNFDWSGLPKLRNLLALNLLDAIAAATIEAQASSDLNAFQQSPAAPLLDGLLAQEQVIVQDDRISAKLSLQNRNLTINGKSVPVEQFF